MNSTNRLTVASVIVILAAVLVATACAPADDALPGLTRASGEERATLLRAIADYYTVRERAFVSGDMASLLAAYPKLAHGEDVREGINLDAFWAPHLRDLGVADVSDDLEGYEPARVYVRGNAAVAFVHGWEIWYYPRGDHTGLEFFTRIDVVSDAGRWIVERTDQQMMGEPRPRVPNR
jgi:hypothetical protein